MKVHEQHKSKGPKIINIALIIVSTSRFEELKNGKVKSDKTIPLVKQLIRNKSGYSLISSEIVSDSEVQIKKILEKLMLDDDLHVIIYSGGTGFTSKDITYETIEPLLEKRMDGFGELFRYLSFKEIGPSAMLSRAIAGKYRNKAIFLLPGSPNAVRLALNELILPEVKHIIYSINKEE